MVKKTVLIAVRKGLYSTLPLEQVSDFQLGAALIHKFCYVSTETVLAEEGIVFQEIYPITYVSSVSEKIEENGKNYLYRQLNNKFLYSPYGVRMEDGVYIADKERAAADILYFNPKYYFDNEEGLDVNRLADIQKKVGYK